MRPHSETCAGKKPYGTRDEARSAAAALHRAKGWRVSAYRCKACAKWHVGHRLIRKPRKVR